MSLIHALKWSFFSELAAKAIQPVIFIVLARLLTPEDFGVMTAALMVIAFTQVFWEAGMGKALIQRRTDIDQAANAAFWINIALGLVIAALLFFAARPVADSFFHDERVAAVLQVMTLHVLLGAMSSAHTALLQKEMGFKKLFWVRFATVSLPGLASIPLAWNGMGYWALVAGALVGQLAQVVVLWRMSHWRPAWAFHPAVAKEMGRFGAWVGASGLLAWFYVWADALIVGMYLGSHDLGLYRTGNQFAAMIFAFLFGPVLPVFYSLISRTGNDSAAMREATAKVVNTITFISIPISVAVFSYSSQIANALFAGGWQGIDRVIGVMAISGGIAWIVGMNGEFYRASNKPNYETMVMAIALLMYVPIYFFFVRKGLDAFLYARLATAAMGTVLQLYFLYRLGGIRLLPIVKNITKVTGISFVCFFGVLALVRPLPGIESIATAALSALMACLILYFAGGNLILAEAKRIYAGRHA